MQIAGQSCVVCEKTVPSEAQGAGCLACDVVFHRTCLADPAHCAQCGASFEQQVTAMEADARNDLAARRRRGTAWLWTLTIVLVALVAASGTMIWSLEPSLVTHALLDLAFVAILLMLFHAGNPLARKVLLVMTALSAIADLWGGPLLLRVAGAALVAIAAVLAYSKDLMLVFAERARARGYRVAG